MGGPPAQKLIGRQSSPLLVALTSMAPVCLVQQRRSRCVRTCKTSTNRKVLAEAGESIAKFTGQGIAELGDRLGPILWQFMPTKRFDPDDFGAFLKLLPASVDGVPLRHAVEVRHESFDDPIFLTMAHEAGAAVVLADHDEYPAIGGHDVGFSYLRLMRARASDESGYPVDELKFWAEKAQALAGQGDCYAFFIAGAKEHNPAAAQKMAELL